MPNTRKYLYALNTSTITGCGELSLPDKIRITAEAGYDAIEPWVREVDQYISAGGTVEELKDVIDENQLQVVNLIGFFEWAVDNDGDRAKGIDEAKRAFVLAQALGCPYVAAPPSGIYQTPGVDLLAIANRYGELIDLAAGFSVIPVVEFWGIAQSLGKLGEALLVATESGRSEACLLADIFHMYKGSGQFYGLDLIGPSSVAILHMNDYPATPERGAIKDNERVYPGDGVAPWAQIMGSLERTGFSGVMSLELFNNTYYAQDPLVVAKTGLEKMKQVVSMRD